MADHPQGEVQKSALPIIPIPRLAGAPDLPVRGFDIQDRMGRVAKGRSGLMTLAGLCVVHLVLGLWMTCSSIADAAETNPPQLPPSPGGLSEVGPAPVKEEIAAARREFDLAKNYPEVFNQMKRAAAMGDAEAQFRLGERYLEGVGVAQDYKEAVRWFRKAADQRNAFGQFGLGWMSENGYGVTKDPKAAVEWYRKAADQGFAQAQNNLGGMYRTGEGVAKDLKAAVAWYRKAADQGNANAQNNLGVIFKDGEGAAKDLKAAVAWYRKAADQRNAFGQFSLGWMYEKGYGVTKDPKAAILWYRKAADQRNSSAQFSLGSMYENGEGVAKDPKVAVAWYRKAADQGLAQAQNNLGGMYRTGEGVAKDLKAAVAWYRKAADQGFAEAQNNLGMMYLNGIGVSKNMVFAYKWLLLAQSNMNNELLRKMTTSVESELSPALQEQGQRLAAAFVPVVSTPGGSRVRQRSVMEIEGWDHGPQAQPRPPATNEQAAISPVVQPAAFGTGFLISSSGVVVTAAHVVTKAKSISARLPSGTSIPLRLLRVDEKNDLAVLQADIPAGSAPLVLPIISSRNLTLGQPVMTIGFPNPEIQGLAPKYTQGTISSLTGISDNPTSLQISVPVQPGNSGGALVDYSGRVVGVVVARLDGIKMAKKTGFLTENVNYAVKGSQLLAFLENLPGLGSLPDAEVTPPPSTPTSETIQKVKDATLFIIVEH